MDNDNKLTVRAVPQRKVLRALMVPGSLTNSSTPKNNFAMAGPSPAMMIIGASTTALKAFVYQERSNALPLTTVRLCLITTECNAVSAELVTPKRTPTEEIFVPSRNTPTKNPIVTTEHESRMRREGRVFRNTYEVQTVNGRTRPRAIW